jgi:hypothetical protein
VTLTSKVRRGVSAAVSCAIMASAACAAQPDPLDRFLRASISGPALRELRDHFPEEWARMSRILLAPSTAERRSTAIIDEFNRFIDARSAQVREAPDDILVALVSARRDLIHAQAEAAPLACASFMTSHPVWEGSPSPDLWAVQYNFYRLSLIAIERGAASPTHHNVPRDEHFERLRQVLVARRVPAPIIEAIVVRQSSDTLPTDQRCPAAVALLDGVASLSTQDQADFESFSGP